VEDKREEELEQDLALYRGFYEPVCVSITRQRVEEKTHPGF